ncbi:MAG: hypothetical protein KDD40_04405, partial [Bdellovibrionales bacterium]|nr:hypothetical protein [Bdellovibrionales bacterium]
MFNFLCQNTSLQTKKTLATYWPVTHISHEGVLTTENKLGFMFNVTGLEGSFLTTEQLTALHREWRANLRMNPNEEIQFLFSKRVDLERWVEEQLQQSFLAESAYGRRILLDRLANQLQQMSTDVPEVLSQKITVCFWCHESLNPEDLKEKKALVHAMLNSFGLKAEILNGQQLLETIHFSAQDLECVEKQALEWPEINIEASHIKINENNFRALELQKLPEHYTELGMIQSLSLLPFPLDISVRLVARDNQPIIARLEKKRNMLLSQKGFKNVSTAPVDSQF